MKFMDAVQFMGSNHGRTLFNEVVDFMCDNNDTVSFDPHVDYVNANVGTCGLRPDWAAMANEPVSLFDVTADKENWSDEKRAEMAWMSRRISKCNRLHWLQEQLSEAIKTGEAPLYRMTAAEISWMTKQYGARRVELTKVRKTRQQWKEERAEQRRIREEAEAERKRIAEEERWPNLTPPDGKIDDDTGQMIKWLEGKFSFTVSSLRTYGWTDGQIVQHLAGK